MIKIRYAGINRIVHNTDKSKSLLDISVANQVPHMHECGGRGLCSTCRVRILEGTSNLNPRNATEQKVSIARKWDPSIRLACQAYPKGNVTVQRLIWSMSEVNELQKELAPVGKAEERFTAILFCDLRGFTRLSFENMNFDLAFMLNKFYTLLGEPILLNNGIIYQYIGDEIVGVFGTTGGSPRKICTEAVRAAMGMQYALTQLNEIELKDFNVSLRSGIGINFGKAYVGYLGHPNYKQFSIIGDAVNVASRIQEKTKYKDAKILISKSVLSNIGENKVLIGRSFKARLAGRGKQTLVHELKGFIEMDLLLELQWSLNIILEEPDKFAKAFYQKLFEKSPEIRCLFKNNMTDQGKMFTHMLSGIVYSFSRPKHLVSGLKKLGKNHHSYGVKQEYYPMVRSALMETIDLTINMHKTENTMKAWGKALDYVLDIMKNWNESSSTTAGNKRELAITSHIK